MQDSVETVRAEVYVSGRVQGVFFRQFTKDAAIKIGVNGYTQNLPDGRVKVVAEGDRKSVDMLLEKLRSGPRFSNVENLDVIWQEPSGEFLDFHIRR
ncbi:MAG: acylphosphatase [Methanosarcinaceae archaeon]|nr:acylphosphatase [Methanosarcinaceae archaeon]